MREEPEVLVSEAVRIRFVAQHIKNIASTGIVIQALKHCPWYSSPFLCDRSIIFAPAHIQPDGCSQAVQRGLFPLELPAIDPCSSVVYRALCTRDSLCGMVYSQGPYLVLCRIHHWWSSYDILFHLVVFPFLTSFIVETVGYAMRAIARDQTDQLMPYVLQSTFLLVAPALFAASVYMVLGRVIRNLSADSLSVIPVRWLTKIFVCGDVISFMIQAGGAGIMVSADSMSTGENIILAGLFVQIVIFGLFAITAAIFHSRFRKRNPNALQDYGKGWEQTMVMLYVVSVLIMIRSIFRVVEYAMGHDGYPLGNEWTLYVFDGVLMFGVVAMFVWRFPSNLGRRAFNASANTSSAPPERGIPMVCK